MCSACGCSASVVVMSLMIGCCFILLMEKEVIASRSEEFASRSEEFAFKSKEFAFKSKEFAFMTIFTRITCSLLTFLMDSL